MDLLKLSEIFEPRLLEEIARIGKEWRFPAGRVLMNSGDPIVHIPLVLEGSVKVSRIEEEGRELLLYFINPKEGCAMTFVCCMQSAPGEIRAVTEEDTRLILIPQSIMDEWLVRFPTWKYFVMESIRGRFHELLRTIDQLTFHPLEDRIRHYLSERSRNSGSALVNASHEQIALDLASSRVVISRILKKMENEGTLLLFRNQIKIMKEL